MIRSTRLSQTSHCLLCKRTYFSCLCALGTLEIDGLGEAHFWRQAKNPDAFPGSLEWDIGNVFHYSPRNRLQSRWHFRAWQSCRLIPEAAHAVLAWWQRVLLLTCWGNKDGQGCQWEEYPGQLAVMSTSHSTHPRMTRGKRHLSFSAACIARQATDCCLCYLTSKYLQAIFFLLLRRLSLIHLFLICLLPSPHTPWTL